MSHVFTGPVFLEVRPFRSANLWSRLVQQIPYGMTVWRDATGVWQQKYGPSPTDLAGATVVYGGGRTYHLTAAQVADLTAGGFGAYITTVPGPALADVSVTDDPAAFAADQGVIP